MDKPIIVRATVTLTIEVDVEDRWGNDCPMSQVHKQATESALGKVRQGIDLRVGTARLVGTPRVVAIAVEEKR